MSKFKVGDKVVVLGGKGLTYRQKLLVGKTGTVKHVYHLEIIIDLIDTYFEEDELELKEIYESPLYKALQEIE